MTDIMLPGDDARDLVGSLRALADSIEAMADGAGPTDADMADAPLLSRWHLATIRRPSLTGIVTGHPRLGDARPIRTSEIYALNRDAGWARTYSRYYRLGPHHNDGRPQ